MNMLGIETTRLLKQWVRLHPCDPS
uniref:Uncharacterized protein n=1 Tax=Rhizophora mucronata TaxID=61149 RepID=A0A2P2NAD8_RHIMU